MEESMVDTSITLAAVVSESSKGKDRPATTNLSDIFDRAKRQKFNAKIYHLTKEEINIGVYITDENGIVVYHSQEADQIGKDYSRWNDVRRTLNGNYGARATMEDPKDPMSLQLYVAAPIIVEGKRIGVLTITKPTMSVLSFVLNAKDSIIVAGLISAGSVVLIVMLFTHWFTNPLQKLHHYVESIHKGSRVAYPKLGKGEINDLGQSFERMKDRLEGRKYMENYIHTLTHEMKSPISAIAGAAELLHEDMPEEKRYQFLNNISTETVRLKDLVERLLRLSSIESMKHLDHIESINIEAMFSELKNKFQLTLDTKNIDFEHTIQVEEISGDIFLIQQALDNLLQNAIDFIHPGGKIVLKSTQQGDAIFLEVYDNGPGIPEFAEARVLERFYSLPRPDNGKKSTGLGLAIVKEIMQLHHGELKLEKNDPHGVKASLVFPNKG